jgi:hypothetical protein
MEREECKSMPLYRGENESQMDREKKQVTCSQEEQESKE